MKRNTHMGATIGEKVATAVTDRFLTTPVEGSPTHARKDLRAKLIACNELGDRVGESHHKATLTDAQVDQIRDRFEAHPLGDPRHEGYRLLAREFGVSKRTIRSIVNYERRNVWAAKWKRVTTG